MTQGRIEETGNLDDESDIDIGTDDALTSSDVTPLALAATKNQFDIVKLFLSLGEKIEEPHEYDCDCETCEGSPHYDEYRFAKKRLTFYRALASDSYLTLSSTDPILAGFQLARKLRKLSTVERHFKVSKHR